MDLVIVYCWVMTGHGDDSIIDSAEVFTSREKANEWVAKQAKQIIDELSEVNGEDEHPVLEMNEDSASVDDQVWWTFVSQKLDPAE